MPLRSPGQPPVPSTKADEGEARATGGRPSSRLDRVPWLGAVVISLCVGLAYARTFDVPFLFDDAPSIAENPTIRDLGDIAKVLSPPRDTGRTVNGRPALNLSFALNYAVGGTSVAGYHAGNLLCHILACLFLFGIVRRTLQLPSFSEPLRSRAGIIALSVALVWGLHPLHTAAVTYIVQRAEIQMGLCYLLTLYCVIRGAESARPSVWHGTVIAVCAFGMATKESMVTAPVMVALYDRTFLAGSWRKIWSRRPMLYSGLAVTWVLLALLVAGSGGRGGTAGWTAQMSASDYALIQLHAVTRYLWLTVWPRSLIFDYGASCTAPWLATAGCTIVIAGMVAATVVSWRRHPAIGILGAWFLLLLAPTSSFLPVATQVIAEHRVYLPLAAVAALVVVASFSFCGATGVASALTIGIALGVATLARNETYRDARRLWWDTVTKLPTNPRAHYNYALLSAEAGREAEALVHFEQVVRLQPRDVEARNKLAVALLRAGRLDEAERHLGEALRTQPDYAEAHNNLGVALARAGRLAEALPHFQAVARLRPDSFEANFNLGNIFAQLGRREEAIAAYEKARRINPEHGGVREMLIRIRGG